MKEAIGFRRNLGRRLLIHQSHAAKVAGQLIKNIEIPLECVVAAVIRGKQFVVPRGETEIFAGDQVILVGPATAVKKAKEIFLESI